MGIGRKATGGAGCAGPQPRYFLNPPASGIVYDDGVSHNTSSAADALAASPDAAVQPSLYAEDLEVGRVFQLGSYELDREDLLDFAGRWDPQLFHTDEAFASAGFFDGLIASGIQTLAIYQRLAVSGVLRHWWVVAGRSFRDLRFLGPVRPGMVLVGELTVEDVEFARPDRALVTTSGRLLVEGEPVLSLGTDAWIHRRPDA